MQLTRLIYASNHDGIAVEEVDRILQTSRAHNHRDGITGALIVSDKNFMQLLEGDRAAVASCFTRITQDDRHRDVQVISAGDADDRLFAEWSMHFIKASRIKQELLSRYLINSVFKPAGLSQVAITELCHELAAGDWEAMAA